MASGFRITQLVLRVFEWLFALIAFSAAAWLLNNAPKSGTYDDGSGVASSWSLTTSAVSFMVFTGVTAWLITMLYAAAYFVEGLQRTLLGVVEVVVNALWVIFWLAAAASFAAEYLCKPDARALSLFNNCSTFLAASAFAWMSWLLWIGSLVMSIIDMRNGEGITGGAKRYPMGTAPQV